MKKYWTNPNMKNQCQMAKDSSISLQLLQISVINKQSHRNKGKRFKIIIKSLYNFSNILTKNQSQKWHQVILKNKAQIKFINRWLKIHQRATTCINMINHLKSIKANLKSAINSSHKRRSKYKILLIHGQEF